MNRLAVMDWGIGGLGFWKEWKKVRPGDGIIYFSDCGFKPYGKLSNQTLKSRLEQVITWLAQEYGVTHLVVACNAASTALPEISVSGVEVSGMIQAAVREVRKVISPGPISIAGGRRTIKSGIYQRLLSDYEVSGIVAQPLSAIVEMGRVDEADTVDLVEDVLRGTKPDLLLACTHYVALKKVIHRVFPDLRIYDPVPRLASELEKAWTEMPGDDLFLTTGSAEEMALTGRAAFGVEMSKPMALKVP